MPAPNRLTTLAQSTNRAARPPTPLDRYAKTVQLNPDSGLADDALWWRGRILEDDKKLDDARVTLRTPAQGLPGLVVGEGRRFRRGLLQYRAGKYRDAANAWGDALPTSSSSRTASASSFGEAKRYSRLTTGRRFAELQRLSTDSELDYFGMRAAALLQNKNGQPKATRESKIDFNVQFDWPAAEAWPPRRAV